MYHQTAANRGMVHRRRIDNGPVWFEEKVVLTEMLDGVVNLVACCRPLARHSNEVCPNVPWEQYEPMRGSSRYCLSGH